MSIHIDFETRSKIDIVRQGVYRYAMDESTDVLCVALGFGQSEVQVFDTLPLHIIELLKQRIKEGGLFFAFNANFERQIWRHVFAKKYGLPDIPVNQWRCVAAEAMSCGLPASLDGVAKALDLGVQKDAKGSRLINKYSKPLPNGMFMPLIGQDKIDFMSYCKRDVEVEREISAGVPFLSSYEQKVWELDQDINDRGIRIDTKGVEDALRIIEEEKTKGEELLRRATNGQVQSVTEVGKIKDFLGMESLTKQTVKDAVKDATGDALTVLELRAELGQTALAKYDAMKACCGTDGRVRGLLMYHAAHTGRWGGRLIQPQNLPQGKVKGCHAIDLRYDNLPLIELVAKPLDFVSSAIRNMFLADEGEELVMVDYAAIEARVVAWLAGCQTALDIFARQDAGDKTADIYKLMASEIYGKPVMEVTKSERQLGKIAVLGCVAKDTIVYSDSGIVFVQDLETGDRIWDGEKFVCFRELVPTGKKNVINLTGVKLTPDHPVLTNQGWQLAGEIDSSGATLLRPLAPRSEISPSYRTNISAVQNAWSILAVYVALYKALGSTNYTSEKQSSVLNALRVLQDNLAGDPESILISFLTRVCALDGEPVGSTLTSVVKTQTTKTPRGIILEAYASASTPAESSWNILLRSMAMTDGDIPSIELITTGTTLKEISDAYRRLKTIGIEATECYDIVGCGPENRFSVGPFIAHNCGYGMGADKFQQSCAGFGVTIDKELAEKSVKTYRATFKEIPAFWRKLEQDGVHERGNFYRDKNMPAFLLYRLPSGRNLCYYKWSTLNGRPSHLAKELGSTGMVRRETYGGRLTENVTQAVARDIMADAMLRLKEVGYNIVLTVHDEIVVSVKDAKNHVDNICKIMKTPPAWAKGLPLNVEADVYHKYKK